MSYILDALKKSERERELVRMLRTAGTSNHFWMPTRRRMWPAIIGLVLLIGITVTVVRFWSPTDRSLAASADRSSVPVPTAATEPAKAPVVTSDGQQNAITVGHAKTATDDLAAQLQSTSAQRPAAAARPQADAVIAKTVAPNTAVTTAEPVDPATVPFLREMPNEFRRKLPELVVNVHLYSANEAENLVYINNQQLRRGEQLEGGIRLEAIVPEGVVLSYAGTLFKLPRPN
jgi:general secretion pathway protein B